MPNPVVTIHAIPAIHAVPAIPPPAGGAAGAGPRSVHTSVNRKAMAPLARVTAPAIFPLTLIPSPSTCTAPASYHPAHIRANAVTRAPPRLSAAPIGLSPAHASGDGRRNKTTDMPIRTDDNSK